MLLCKNGAQGIVKADEKVINVKAHEGDVFCVYAA